MFPWYGSHRFYYIDPGKYLSFMQIFIEGSLKFIEFYILTGGHNVPVKLLEGRYTEHGPGLRGINNGSFREHRYWHLRWPGVSEGYPTLRPGEDISSVWQHHQQWILMFGREAATGWDLW